MSRCRHVYGEVGLKPSVWSWSWWPDCRQLAWSSSLSREEDSHVCFNCAPNEPDHLWCHSLQGFGGKNFKELSIKTSWVWLVASHTQALQKSSPALCSFNNWGHVLLYVTMWHVRRHKNSLVCLPAPPIVTLSMAAVCAHCWCHFPHSQMKILSLLHGQTAAWT